MKNVLFLEVITDLVYSKDFKFLFLSDIWNLKNNIHNPKPEKERLLIIMQSQCQYILLGAITHYSCIHSKISLKFTFT